MAQNLEYLEMISEFRVSKMHFLPWSKVFLQTLF